LAPSSPFFAADGQKRGLDPREKTNFGGARHHALVTRVIADWTLIPLGAPVMIVTFILLLRRSALNFAQPIAFLRHISSKIV